MTVSDATRLKILATRNSGLKRLLAESLLENKDTREVLLKKKPQQPGGLLVRTMIQSGLSERRSLEIVSMSARALRYKPVVDNNAALRPEIGRMAPIAIGATRRR